MEKMREKEIEGGNREKRIAGGNREWESREESREGSAGEKRKKEVLEKNARGSAVMTILDQVGRPKWSKLKFSRNARQVLETL